MEERNEAQRLGIGEGRDEEAQKFAQGKGGANFAQGEGVVRISHKWIGSANFAQCTIHPCKCEIGFFQMAKSFGF